VEENSQVRIQTHRKLTASVTSSSMSTHWGWQTLLLALFISLWSLQTLANAQARHEARGFFNKHGNGNHTNNWAVLVCASRYWFNYRVGSRLHIPPSRSQTIILACSIWPMLLECKPLNRTLRQHACRSTGPQVPHCKTARHSRLQHNPHAR
jgi:hypothetical protein